METDWAQAWQIGGLGFGLVFVVLILLALAMWLTGRLISRIGAGKGEAGDEAKGE